MCTDVPINLDLIAPSLRDLALRSLEEGDVLGFLIRAAHGNTEWLTIVAANATAFLARGLYEPALLHAWEATRTNHAHVSATDLRTLFAWADKSRLRAHSDPLPGPGPFTVYRGVAGNGLRRRHRGMSWTVAFDCAAWFARRYSLPNPAVLRVDVEARDVLVYLSGRGEQEFVVDLPPGKRPTIQTRDSAEIETAAARWAAKIRKDREDRSKKATGRQAH